MACGLIPPMDIGNVALLVIDLPLVGLFARIMTIPQRYLTPLIAILARAFGIDRRSATLASAPGTISNAVAIAAEGHGDATVVMFVRLMRLLLLVVFVPPPAAVLDAPAAGAGATRP